jgi:hypothetical protein
MVLMFFHVEVVGVVNGNDDVITVKVFDDSVVTKSYHPTSILVHSVVE